MHLKISIITQKTACYLALAALYLCACADQQRQQQIPPGAIPIVYTSYIFVQALVDSVPANLLLDTGADNLYLDSLYYAASGFNYPKTRRRSISGVGNSRQNILIIDDSLNFTFNNHQYRTSHVVVLMLKPAGGDYLDGLLGTSYFMHNVLQVDYDNGYIKTYSSHDSIDLSGYTRIPMRALDYSFTIPLSIKINDTLTIHGDFAVDIGSPGTIINSSVVQQYHLDQAITHKARYYTKYAGVGNDSDGYDFIPDTVRLANHFAMQQPTVSYSIDTAGVLAADDHMGILGGNILSRFDLVFDFLDTALYLRPNSIYKSPFIYDRLGFTFTDRYSTLGGWVVASITYNSQADQHGLQIDDLIVAVNGLPVQQIPYVEQDAYFDRQKRVNLTVQRADTTLNIAFDLISLL